MLTGRLPRRLLYLAVLVHITSGCQALQADRPVPVLVRDAETKKPIPAAEVYLCNYVADDAVLYCSSSRITKEDGIARLRIGSIGKEGIQLQAVASGYMPSEVDVKAGDVERIEPAHLLELTDERPPCFVVEVYSEPPFTVELVVPAGYRGLVKAEVQAEEKAFPGPPGQRCLHFVVEESGDVQVRGPSCLRRIAGMDFHASYSDGTPLREEREAQKVGFRWVKTEGKVHYFVVGTQAEYEALCARLVPQVAKVESGVPVGGGKSGGVGRRHRRGGQAVGE
jgi:hypothetical protein